MTKIVRIEARITTEQLDKVRAMQSRTGLNPSQIIRTLIDQAELIQETKISAPALSTKQPFTIK